MKKIDARDHVGKTFKKVTLELFRGEQTRPRVRAVDTFLDDPLVYFPMKMREGPIMGTRFFATVKVCQKHWNATGKPKGSPYLVASSIEVIPASIKPRGLVAKKKPGSISGRSHQYELKKTR